MSSIVDSYLVKVYEGSNIVGLYQLLSIKFNTDTASSPTQGQYGIAKDPDLQRVWEANGQTGDYRDKTVVTECSMTLPLSNGVSSRAVSYTHLTLPTICSV